MEFTLGLPQGNFTIEQDRGWRTIATTTASRRHLRGCYGMGFAGYTWEENGPSLPARAGEQSLEAHVRALCELPFCDCLYIRCDWRQVQSRAGRLDFDPIWDLTLAAAEQYNLRVGFRVQLSSPNFQPEQLAMPDFLQDKIPFVEIGQSKRGVYREPRYDHPAFRAAFAELNQLLAERLDGHPRLDFMDLMMYGFWGEGHTGAHPKPFDDFYTAERTFRDMTELQLAAWKKTRIAVNTQPDINEVGNDRLHRACLDAGTWLRSDSIYTEEPQQVGMMRNRPTPCALILEDGAKRAYRLDEPYLAADAQGPRMDRNMRLALDAGASYWSLWTEGNNIAKYYEQYPDAINEMSARIGYRVRPAWVWQRKRYETDELVVAFANDGVAGVPGRLRVTVQDQAGNILAGGTLDAGAPEPGRLQQAAFMLPTGCEGKTLYLKAEVLDLGQLHPVPWACAEELEADGRFAVTLCGHEEKGWRYRV